MCVINFECLLEYFINIQWSSPLPIIWAPFNMCTIKQDCYPGVLWKHQLMGHAEIHLMGPIYLSTHSNGREHYWNEHDSGTNVCQGASS